MGLSPNVALSQRLQDFVLRDWLFAISSRIQIDPAQRAADGATRRAAAWHGRLPKTLFTVGGRAKSAAR